MIVIGIDPGAGGGIAWANGQAYVMPMPETRGDAISTFKNIIGNETEVVAYIEKVASFIPDGGASAMFEFGRNVERCGCILETLGVRLIEVTPKAWQKELGLGGSDRMKVPSPPRGSTREQKRIFNQANAQEIQSAKAHNARAKTDWKNKLKSEAQRRFPNIKITLKTCDALLILDYARIKEGVKILPTPIKQHPPIPEEEQLPFSSIS